MSECNLKFFFNLERDGKRRVIEWCMEKGLIASRYECPRCNCDMKLKERKDAQDGFEWRCQKTGENAHLVKRSVRKGSWFEESNLSIVKVLCMTRMWFTKCSRKCIMSELDVSGPTVTDWKMFCREVCMDLCARNSVPIGGEGEIVEIDESKFGKRKYNRGKHVDGKWVFGGLQRGSNKCFMKVVPNRSKEVLLEIIRDNVLPGTTIISDCWRAYDCLSDEGFEHLRVNHSMTFKDPESGAHTNSIEGTWSAVKRGLQGTNHVEGQFDSYLAEYIWRRSIDHSFDDEFFFNFLSCVKDAYQPNQQDN